VSASIADARRHSQRAHNFSAGPAALPLEVLERVRADLTDYQGRGLSVMEMSHRSAEFIAIAEQAEADLRTLLSIPDDYAVLFLQGGASLMFSMLPMNLSTAEQSLAYALTGHWSVKAVEEAGRLRDVHLVEDNRAAKHADMRDPAGWEVPSDAAYLHLTPNETIAGIAYEDRPATALPIVADLSSVILSQPLDVSRYGVIYAGAQKNIGPAGLTVLIVRRDLMRAVDGLPKQLSLKAHADAGSMLNTPPTFAWYMAGQVFRWLLEQGGLAEMGRRNTAKAAALYAAIDASSLYSAPVAARWRSRTNVPFTLADPALDERFLAEAGAAGLVNLAGHRSVGGMRASIYNAVEQASVDALISFMHAFEARCA